jgi:predicted RNase H-like HicB family nuclease
MKLRLVVEKDAATGRWASYFPEIPGCASAGDTEEEAIANAHEALELWFEPAPLNLSADAKVVEVAVP